MPVSRDQLEHQLQRVQQRVRDPRAGLFGKDSLVWQINREQLIFLGGGRAALLQEAHPVVAHGVDQHSATRTDPQGRFRRTFRHVYAMVYGDLETALSSARRVHAIHERIHGTLPTGEAYAANMERALLWVHATLWDTSIQIYELIFRRLSAAEKERYYQDTKLFGYLFGLDDDVLPPTWADFQHYNRRMWRSDALRVDSVGREMQRFLFAAPSPHLVRPMQWYGIVTAGLLPARVREMYGLPFGLRERAIFRASIPALRATARALPRQQRFNHGYQRARARLGDPLVPTWMEKVAVSLTPRVPV